MQLNLSFTEGFAKLDIIGIPDNSLGQDRDTIGILLSWKLKLIGSSVLEGKKEHLENLLYVTYSYARYSISGQFHTVSDYSNSISMSKHKNGHMLRLVSKQKDIDPLSIFLDDAEFSDLVKCLDQIYLDNRIAIEWKIPSFNPLSKKELKSNSFTLNKIMYSLTGSLLLVATGFLFILLSEPSKQKDSITVTNDTEQVNLLN